MKHQRSDSHPVTTDCRDHRPASAHRAAPRRPVARRAWLFVLALLVALGAAAAMALPASAEEPQLPLFQTPALSGAPILFDDAYQIGTAEELAWFRDLVNGTLADGTPQNAAANAVLTADIDLSSVCGATAGPEGAELSWAPIGIPATPGVQATPYTGDFNGNGKQLTNLYINTSSDGAALFGNNSGTIRNLTIGSGTLKSSGSGVGSLVGMNVGGSVYCCVNLADVVSTNQMAGGLVGVFQGGAISQCANKGDVSARAIAGGLVGATLESAGSITDCYNTGAVTASEAASGGMLGYLYSILTLENCYNAGNVTAPSIAAGAIGYPIYELFSASNNYFLQTATVNAGLMATGIQPLPETQARAVDDAGLQALAPTLGAAYQADSGSINGGYPVLTWEMGGGLFGGFSATPIFETNLGASIYFLRGASGELSVSATAPDGGDLTYEWHMSTTSASAGFAPIEGATGATYSISTETLGTAWYYVSVTNTKADKEPSTFKSTTATVTVVESWPLTMELDGQEYSGGSVQHIAEMIYPGGLNAAKNLKTFEIVSGAFSKADHTYLMDTLVGGNTNSDDISVLFAPGVDLTAAYGDTNGLRVASQKLSRLEIPGLATLSHAVLRGMSGDRFATLYAPDVETVGYVPSGSVMIPNTFEGKITALYLPKLKTIRDWAFTPTAANTSLTNIILPGDTMPTLAATRETWAFAGAASTYTVWVPADLVDTYKNVSDGNTTDGKWHTCTVKAIPAAVTGGTDLEKLQSFVQWAVDQVPALDDITPANEQAVLLARSVVNVLPYSLATGDMADEIQKAYDSYERLHTVLLADMEAQIAALPDPASVELGDEDQIVGVWNTYANFNSVFKPEILATSVTRLNEVYSRLQELLYEWQVVNETPFVSLVTLTDGYKRAHFGQTFDEFKYSSVSGLSSSTVYVARGNFTAQQFFVDSKYQNHKTVVASNQVTIDNGVLESGSYSLSNTLQRLEIPTVTRIGTKVLKTTNQAANWYLIIPNIVSLGTDAYYDTSTSRKNKAALYLPLMSKLEDCKTILRADSPLMLPRLATGERVFHATPQQYVLLPALTNAGASFFANSTALKAAWLPKATKIDGSAFSGSGITELYLAATPPAVLGTGGLASTSSERTLYVPDGAQDTYMAVDDGDTTDDAWYGWAVEPLSASTGLDELLDSYISALPTGSGLTQDYLEWLAHLAVARESLTEAQRAGVDNATLDDALATVAAPESGDIANVEDLIEALGDPASVTLAQRATIEAARAAFDALSKPAQLQVENRRGLFAAEAALRVLVLDDLHDRIAQIPDPVTADDVQFIRAIYSDYLDLTDDEQAQLAAADVEKLDAAIDEVARIEADLLKADAIESRIAALPDVLQIKLKHESTIRSIRAAYKRLSARAKSYVGSEALDKLKAAEARIAELKGLPTDQKTVYVAIEKFTLGRGYVQTPIPVTITPESSPNVAAIVLDVIGEGKCRHGGSVSSSFYLKAIKDDDRSEVVIPQYILDKIAAGHEIVGTRNTQDWLGEMDYTSMSGWMYTVNNTAPSVGASSYTYATLESGDVIRWQYTVYGYGADLGFDGYGGGKYRDVADKDELTAEIAEVDASAEKSVWLQDATYAAAYAQAYSAISSMTSTQEQVDACVVALKKKPSTNELGTVTVSVSDDAPRRQAISTSVGAAIQFENLTGLGSYQQPFGKVIEDVEVPITAGMNVREAVVAALEDEGYDVTTASGRITGVGPLTTCDRTATVAKLAKGDAGGRSKWVLSQNGYAIAQCESAADFLVRDGDQLSLDYSIDGGYDVGCFPYTSTYFTIAYSVDARLKGADSAWDAYVPEGTESLALSYTREGPSAAPELYNRAHKLFIRSNQVDYRGAESIPVTAGQAIELTVSNPMSAGGSVYDSINDQATGSGVDRTLTVTVKYLKTPAHLQAAIEALPPVAELDYDLHNDTITDLAAQYSLFTQAERDQVSAGAVAKLQAAVAKMTELYNADDAKVDQIIALVNGYYGKITAANHADHEDAVNQSLALYGELNSRTAAAFRETVHYLRMQSAKDLIDRYSAGDTSTIGIPTDYENDFLLSANAFNLDLGKADDAYQVVFLDTPRIGNEGFHLPGRVQFEIKDPSIFEIEEVPYTYVDNGLGGGGAKYPSVKYYLVPKKAGTTTFTCTFDGFSGQTPEMVVHVNAPAESAVDKLAEKLTNISALPKTTKYDTWYYFAGQQGAPFTFKVNGSDPEVHVYEYLSYDGDGAATKTDYPVDADGNVTVLLKDGYNPIEVTATYDGQRVTQVYGIKGKVISYELTNVTTPDSTTFKEGDTVSLKFKGLAPPVYKMLRIYNPSATQFWYDTDLPRYYVIKSGGGQYAATEMQFELTGSGDIVLSNGRIFQDWFGSPLYSETDIGNTGGNAPQSKTTFSHIPDIDIKVAENADYDPTLAAPQIEGGTTIKAGTEATITIPGLDTASLLEQYSLEDTDTNNDFLKGVTQFATDIPNCTIESKTVEAAADINDLKTLEFKVPAGTAPGEYHIYGGRVSVTYGISWWLKYADAFVTQIGDLAIQVTPSDTYLDLYLAKSDARADLAAYADPDEYRLTQQTELAEAVAAGKKAIDRADDTDAVAAALAAAEEAIDAIKTAAELTAEEDDAAITAAKVAVEGATYRVSQAQAADEAAALARVRSVIDGLALNGVNAVVTKVSYVAPVGGTAQSPAGTDGSYVFTVALSKGAGAEQVTGELTLLISATAYEAPSREKPSLADATVTLATRADGTLTWSGHQLKPTVRSVTIGEASYAQDTDFTASYGANTAVGPGTVTLTATTTGALSGERALSFKIVPKATSVSSLKAGKRRLTVRFPEVTKQLKLSRYRIRYRVKGSDAWQARTITSGYADEKTVASATLTNLKRGKRYEVSVRAGKQVAGVWYWSQASGTKTSATIK